MPQDNLVQKEILKLFAEEYLTIKEIAKRRGCSTRAVYKIIKKLKEKGLGGGGVHKEGTTKGGGGVHNGLEKRFKIYFRLHGLHYNISVLSGSSLFSSAAAKGNSIRLLNNVLVFYKEKIEVYQDKNSSFTGPTINECFEKAISYFSDLLYKIEARYNISLIKEGYHNISIVNGHLAEVNNGMARELALDKQYITIFDKEGKSWFKVDYSKHMFKEAETIHPKTFKQDAELVFSNYMNDWRENNPPTNSELAGMLRDSINEIKGIVRPALIQSNTLSEIKARVTSIEELQRYKEYIVCMSTEQKTELEGWIFERFGNSYEIRNS